MNADWRPSASLDVLRKRSEILRTVREFFRNRGVLEVETPALASAAVTDVHIDSLQTFLGYEQRRMFLQTSPEFAMKRLLAAGSGSIFQICKVFRDDPRSSLHNPEFTMLEWYRTGFDHYQLMDEVAQLLSLLRDGGRATRLTYRQAFLKYAAVDPFAAEMSELRACIGRHGIELSPALHEADADTLLDVLMSHIVGPQLGRDVPVMIYDFPANQAALARIRAGDPPVAERFEVFVDGMELANGFHELADESEQRRRFERDNRVREATGKAAGALDERLLSALSAGLPACAGVAMGVDRLVMWLLGLEHVGAAMAFDVGVA